ncbi:TPR repeat-containing protein [Candidatus Gastranaerophilus sp. (ex Termes propinquus)]|nr:TPR repeat-containing protein [Candidatus Gastranaerophilus sp. (ex Termes propinquus)]
MRRFIKFFKKTTVRVVSFLLAVLVIVSFFVFKDFYKRQGKKVLSFYHVHQGDKFYKKQKRQEAIESYKKAVKYYPEHYRAWHNLANIYVTYEDYYSAVESYQKALEVKPTLQAARIDYGIVLAEAMFNYDRAIEEYAKAISLTPKFLYIPFIINNKVTTKHNTSVAWYNTGLAWRGKSLLAGEKNFAARQYLQNAVESYKKSLKIRKTYRAYYNLAIAHHLLRENAHAGLSYCKAIYLEPMNYEAHYNLAILLKDMKNYKASIDEFRKAGLILDVGGNGANARYIYDILNEATRSLVQDGEYQYLVEHLGDDSQIKGGQITYIGGKVVITQELDRAMVSNFRKCKSEAYFKNMLENEPQGGVF